MRATSRPYLRHHLMPQGRGDGSVVAATAVLVTAVAVVAAPGFVVDEAVVVVAQGGGVGTVVPHLVVAVHVEVAVGVVAPAGVDTDRGAAFEAVVVEGVGVAVLVLQGPAVEVDGAAGGVGQLHPLLVQRAPRAVVPSGRVVLDGADLHLRPVGPGVVGRRRRQRHRPDDRGGRQHGGGETTGGHRGRRHKAPRLYEHP